MADARYVLLNATGAMLCANLDTKVPIGTCVPMNVANLFIFTRALCASEIGIAFPARRYFGCKCALTPAIVLAGGSASL